MAEAAEAQGIGAKTVQFRLKDWGISRQRYWGTPIPMIACGQCGIVPVPDDQLPVVLPVVAGFTGRGDSPLAQVAEWVNVACPSCGGPARRETDTMDTFVDSSWYFYRYVTPRQDDAPFDPAKVGYWFPIDLYVGGIEHAILHLVYSRFWTKVMRDLGLVSWSEPVVRLFPQGMVHKDGEVMSKSKGNTVAPDDVIARYGADTLRLYVLAEAPPDMALEWSEERIEGPHRLLQRVWRLVERQREALSAVAGASWPAEPPDAVRVLRRKTHQTIERVTADIERLRVNTAVAAFHELVNEVYRLEGELSEGPGLLALREALDTLLALMNPFAPHMCEELWRQLGHEASLVRHTWPVADAEIAREEQVELAVQVNGKVRSRVVLRPDAGDEEARQAALADPRVREHVDGKQLVKAVVVPGRLVSLVVR
jgi:leucyl-tRNA synthetase